MSSNYQPSPVAVTITIGSDQWMVDYTPDHELSAGSWALILFRWEVPTGEILKSWVGRARTVECDLEDLPYKYKPGTSEKPYPATEEGLVEMMLDNAVYEFNIQMDYFYPDGDYLDATHQARYDQYKARLKFDSTTNRFSKDAE